MESKRIAVRVVATLLIMAVLSREPLAAPPETRPQVFLGTMQSGVVAIGGETTGVQLKTRLQAYELEFPKDSDGARRASEFDGQPVIVTGEFRTRPGVEISERSLIVVQTLVAQSSEELKRLPLLLGEFRSPGTQGVVTLDKETATVEIRCGTGIDRGMITRTGETWPEKIRLRLFLKGLESLRCTAGEAALSWSVSSTGSRETHSSLAQAGKLTELAPSNPWYSPVQAFGRTSGHVRTMPLPDGGFEVVIPAPFLESNPEFFTIEWIDFYRR